MKTLFCCILAVLLLVTDRAQGEQPKPVPKDKAASASPKRRIYVLHSGVHTILSDSWKNIAADTLKEGLLKRGVDPRDIVVLENPYPTASWRKMFPRQSLTMFVDSALPGSKVAHERYVRLHQTLRTQGVKPEDDLIWIGHSAGGQMGLTMAYLAHDLEKFPDLALEASPYHFEMVILLGSPIGSNLLPAHVKLRHYYSPNDRVVRLVVKYGPYLMRTFGYRLGLSMMPNSLNPEDKVRVFLGVEHPYWDIDDRVLDRIVSETNPDYRPLWHSPLLAPGLEMTLMRLVSQALDDRYHISFEDPPIKSP